MSVRYMNSIDSGGRPHQKGAVQASRQMQDWTRGMEISCSRQRSVIDEKRTVLPAFSAQGIRRDVLAAALALLLILFAGARTWKRCMPAGKGSVSFPPASRRWRTQTPCSGTGSPSP